MTDETWTGSNSAKPRHFCKKKKPDSGNPGGHSEVSEREYTELLSKSMTRRFKN